MTQRNRDTELYKKWGMAVRKRDGYCCQMPGCDKRGPSNLQVHHILKWSEYPHLRYEVSNGITLCWACHKSIKNNEAYYVSLFYAIVNTNTSSK